MEILIIKYILILIISFYFLVFLNIALKYRKVKKLYGTAYISKKVIDTLKFKFLVPKYNSKRYDNTKYNLANTGWHLSVESFYIIKHFICFLTLIISMLITNTNIDINIKSISTNLNYGNNISGINIVPNAEVVEKEQQLLKKVDRYLHDLDINIYNEDTIKYIETFIANENIDYDNPNSVALRVLQKIKDINSVENIKMYILIILISYLMYSLPNYLVFIKLQLNDSKKDWEIINYMTVYSVIGRIPPYTIDNILDCMLDISKIYRPILNEFKDSLKENKTKNIESIVDKINDDTMKEMLETIVLANEIGVLETVSSIDDMLENKMHWMDITSRKRRNLKSALAMIPIGIILLLMYNYLMSGLYSINQNMFISF